MSVADVSFDVDETWHDVYSVFAQSLHEHSAWTCLCVSDVDKETILSAPEMMDAKTDASFGCESVCSLDYLLSTGALSLSATSVTTNDDALVDLLDILMCKELHYLQGYSLVQSVLAFPYFLRLDALREASTVLYAYCCAVLRCLDYIARAVFATSIRSDEEFMPMPPEVDRQVERSTEQMLAALDDVIAHTHHTALAARLRFRRGYLCALHQFVEAARRVDVEAACATCSELVMLLESAAYTRASEPAVDTARLLREHEVTYWVSALTPASGTLPAAPFAATVCTYRDMLAQLASLRILYTLPTLRLVSEYVEHFGARQPLLPVRCIAVLVLFRPDPMVSFLHAAPLPQRVLQCLDRECGAPLYLRVYMNDETSIERVVKYRVHKTSDVHKVRPSELAYVRQQTTDTMRRWTMEACKHYLLHLETLLCNRGLAHRRLMNAMTGLAQFADMSYFVDVTVFLAGHPGTSADVEAECSKRSSVLTLFANEQVLRTMERIVQLCFELDVLSCGEVAPALWYLNFLQRARAENATMLCLRHTTDVPALRVSTRLQIPLYSMALCTRTVGAHDAIATTTAEVSRTLSDVVFLAACLFEQAQLVDLTSGPKSALMCVGDAFDHRLHGCFGQVRSPPYMTYARCISAKTQLQADAACRVQQYARKASEVAMTAADKIRALLREHGACNVNDAHALLSLPDAAGRGDTDRRNNNDSNNDSNNSSSSSSGNFSSRKKTVGDGQAASVDDVRVLLMHSSLMTMEKTARATAASLATFAELCDDRALLATYEARLERPGSAGLVTFRVHKRTSS